MTYKKRRSPEEKAKILARAAVTGVTRAARENGVVPSMIHRWRKETGALTPAKIVKAAGPSMPPPSEVPDEYLEACVKEIQARAHRYIAKAAAFERLLVVTRETPVNGTGETLHGFPVVEADAP